MANVITTLLRMDSTQFKTGLKGAQQSIRETDGIINKAKAGWASAFAGFASSPVAIGAASAAVGAFAAQSISAASDLEESINAVNVTFGESADTILEFGANAAKSVGLAKSEFNSLAVPLGSILKNSGVQDFADQTVILTQRAADMASVFNTDVSEALNAIQAGLRGEADPLERFGVGLSAARVEARALADTGKTSAKQLTEQEKALARINIILDQTNQTAGDFANTSDSLANQTRILKAEYKDLQATVGKELVPRLSDLAGALLDVRDAAVLAGNAIGDIPGIPGGNFFRELGEQATFSINPIGAVKSALDGLNGSFTADRQEMDRFSDSVNFMTNAERNALDATTDVADEVVDLGDKAANAGPKIGDMAGVLADLPTDAERAAEALGAVAETAQAVADAVSEAFDEIEDRFSQQDTLAEIAQGWDDIAESAKEAMEGGADERRAYERDVRDQRRAVLDLLDSIHNLPPDTKIRLATEIEQGSLQTLHDIVLQLSGGITVPVSFTMQPGFSGVNGVFSPNQASPVINGTQSAIPSGPVNVTNVYPVGTTPTSAQQDLTTYYRRNGITRS